MSGNEYGQLAEAGLRVRLSGKVSLTAGAEASAVDPSAVRGHRFGGKAAAAQFRRGFLFPVG